MEINVTIKLKPGEEIPKSLVFNPQDIEKLKKSFDNLESIALTIVKDKGNMPLNHPVNRIALKK